MILAIDGVGAKHGGAASVLLAVLSAALDRGDVDRVVVFCSPSRLRRFALPESPRIAEVEVPLAEAGAPFRLWWHLAGLRRATQRSGASSLLLLGGGGVAPSGIRSVAFLQQSIPFSPEALNLLGIGERVRFRFIRWNMGHSCRSATSVAVQTPTMKRCVEQAFGVPGDRIRVFEPHAVVHASNHAVSGLSSMRNASVSFLYVGSNAPHKNIHVMSQAMLQVVERLPDARLFATLDASEPFCQGRGVTGLGYLPSHELREAYALATALVFPSIIETVGLPLIEALASGTPVIAADRPYAHDVCGDAAVYFDPASSTDLAEKMELVARDKGRRAEMSAIGLSIAAARLEGRPYERLVALTVGREK